jgi:8-oxo-dGTP pyrophosphatase MutT (NUDIX family)
MSHSTRKIAAVFIFKEGDKYLFQKRINTGSCDGYYMLPGGHIEEGETVREGGVRELYEELGITVVPDDLELKLVISGKTHVYFFFMVKKYIGTITNKEPDKHGDLSFLPLTAPDLYPSVPNELRSIEKGITFLEYK